MPARTLSRRLSFNGYIYRFACIVDITLDSYLISQLNSSPYLKSRFCSNSNIIVHMLHGFSIYIECIFCLLFPSYEQFFITRLRGVCKLYVCTATVANMLHTSTLTGTHINRHRYIHTHSDRFGAGCQDRDIMAIQNINRLSAVCWVPL